MGEKFVVATGHLLIAGKSPDGDSIRFVPNNLETLQGLEGGHRIRPSTVDGSVQLRLDAIDAPETHFGVRRQPLANAARDELVSFCGFDNVVYQESGEHAGVVTSAEPDVVDAWIVAKLVESHGRPVSYLLPRPRSIDPPLMWREGQSVEVDAAVLDHTANAHMVRSGRAYVTLYTSTPRALRRYFVSLARGTVTTGQSVWASDRSGGFDLVDHDSIGDGGALILPKLFRRASDYLDARDAGTATTFVEWLRGASAGGVSENDQVEINGRRTSLADLITETPLTPRGSHIALNADLLDLVFVEK